MSAFSQTVNWRRKWTKTQGKDKKLNNSRFNPKIFK